MYASIGDGGCDYAGDSGCVTRVNNAILGLFGTPAGNVTVASGFAVGTADLVIDVTGWWR